MFADDDDPEKQQEAIDDLIARSVPESWDLFEVDAQKLVQYAREGKDPTFDTILLHRLIHGQRSRIPGSWKARDVTAEWVYENHGPGDYAVSVYNGINRYVTQKQITIGHPNQKAQQEREDPARSAAASNGAPSGGLDLDAIQKLIMIARSLQPPAPSSGAFEQTVQLMQMQMQQQNAYFQQQMALQQQAPKQNDQVQNLLQTILLPLLTKKADNPLESVGPLIALTEWARKLNGQATDEPEKEWWTDLVPQLGEIAKPLALAITQATLSPEKANAVARMYEGDAAARAAEASYEDDDEPPIQRPPQAPRPVRQNEAAEDMPAPPDPLANMGGMDATG